MRSLLLRALFWLPIVFWLAVEIYWLQGALSVSCALQPGGNRHEVFMLVFLWGFPASVPVAVALDAFLAFSFECSTGGCIVLWLIYCIVGLIQWYFILRGLECLLTRLYRQLRGPRRGATG